MKTINAWSIVILLFIFGCSGKKQSQAETETEELKPTISYTDDQQMITLASIIYDENIDTIKKELSNTVLSTQGKWKLVWGPADAETTRAMVVQDTTITSGKYAVVIRGTIDSLESWFYDFYALKQVKLPWEINGEKMIGAGLAMAFNNIQFMNSNGMNMLKYFESVPDGSEVFVTGHSQGGGLATIVGAWLYDVKKNVTVKPVTFAGQTAGNKLFADGYNQRFSSNTDSALDRRYYNTLDVVPRGFSDILSIKDLYPSPGPECPEDIKLLLDGVQFELEKEQ